MASSQVTTAASRINVSRSPIKHRQHIAVRLLALVTLESGNIFRPQIQNDQLEKRCVIVDKCRYDVYIMHTTKV